MLPGRKSHCSAPAECGHGPHQDHFSRKTQRCLYQHSLSFWGGLTSAERAGELYHPCTAQLQPYNVQCKGGSKERLEIAQKSPEQTLLLTQETHMHTQMQNTLTVLMIYFASVLEEKSHDSSFSTNKTLSLLNKLPN